MRKTTSKLSRLLGVGLMIGWASCSSSDGDEPRRDAVGPAIPTQATLAALSRANDCGDLLTKIQDDAIAKVKLAAELAKTQQGNEGHDVDEANFDAAEEGSSDDDGSDEPSSTPPSRGGVTSGSTPSKAPVPLEPQAGSGANSANDVPSDSSGMAQTTKPSGETVAGPTGASETNAQVKGVEEADFVKVVNNGAGMFLLHGNTLQKLKTYPAAQTALSGTALTIEGSPSEIFVTDQGKAVVFSSAGLRVPSNRGGDSIDYPCPPGGSCAYGGNATKITIADVNVDPPRVERELYYEGSYVSSRRYQSEASDVARVVVQSSSPYSGLFQPNIERYDAWGRAYDTANIEAQLAEWVTRTSASVRNTTLDDWLPSAQEKVSGTLTAVPRACDTYYVPGPGLSEYGLTQVLGLDLKQVAAPVSGVTIVGATSTVYSNAQRLVLAQPDYRWREWDMGFVDAQRTALHVFDLSAASSTYVASGWVSGHLPPFNPQFGIDVGADGTVRVATTGSVRDNPTATRGDAAFGRSHPETYVSLAQVKGNTLEQVGRTNNLGKPRETIQSARFVGDRAYVVTYEQKDPLVVVDVKNPVAPVVLGQISIPGFSQYMHPLDDNHLITVGQGEPSGIQLQLFDVTNPAVAIPPPKVHNFAPGSSSEASYTHKAFTFYNGVLALPVSGYASSPDHRRRYFSSALQLLRVDVNTGFSALGTIDHASLYADNGAGVRCGVCDENGCYDYSCGYAPEVRRGHFVSADNATYVYSFSNAGVLVNDLANLTSPVAKVGLPAPVSSGGRNAGVSKPRPGIAVDEVEPLDDGSDDDDDRFPTPTSDATPPVPALDAGAAEQDAAVGVLDAGTPSSAP